MKRFAIEQLKQWKDKKDRKPLIIRGARQVGKTFEMREFGAHYYKNTVYINFETDEKIGSYFDTDIHADSVVVLLERYYQVKIVPEETLIIFDEIQSLPRDTINLFNEIVSFLSKITNSTILLCSATQPLLENQTRESASFGKA